MKGLTQKWCIVSFLEDVPQGAQFSWKQWPLHVTLAPTFAAPHDAERLAELLDAFQDKPAIKTSGIDTLTWRTDSAKTIEVTQLENSLALQTLHDGLMAVLQRSGAVFNEPQYIGPAFIPHATIQKNNSVAVGDKIIIDNLALIDMFPGADGSQRRIVKTITLQ